MTLFLENSFLAWMQSAPTDAARNEASVGADCIHVRHPLSSIRLMKSRNLQHNLMRHPDIPKRHLGQGTNHDNVSKRPNRPGPKALL